MDLNALLNKPFDELTREDWEALRGGMNDETLTDHLDEQATRHAAIENRIEELGGRWDRIGQIVSELLD